MSADTEFLEELILGLDTATLDWLQTRITRVLASRRSEIIARKTIIRNSESK